MPYSDPARQRAYMAQWIAGRRAAWLAEHGPCADCGTWAKLQVDHIDAATKVTHRVWSWAKARRDAELAKCVVRCEPCHLAKTVAAREKARGEAHGIAKLTAAAVCEIRASSEPLRTLGRRFGVHHSTIAAVRLRQTWRD